MPFSSRLARSLLCLFSLTTAAVGAQPQDPFPITSWELPPNRAELFPDPSIGLARLKSCNFTVAAFVTPADLPTCRTLGLRALVRHDPALDPWRSLTDSQIEQRVRAIIADTAADPTVLGYFLTDEPSALYFPSLAKAAAHVKKLAPGKLAYINLFPDYATPDQLGTPTYADHLSKYLDIVHPQFLSYDNYQVQYSHDQRDPATAASYYHNLLAISALAKEHHLPFWNIVPSNQLTPDFPPPSPANLMLHAYTSLAAGASGVTWYTYYAGGYRYAPIDNQHHPTAIWTYLQLTNLHLKTLGAVTQSLTHTGAYLTNLSSVDHAPTFASPLVTSATTPDQTPLMLGEFTGPNDSAYVLVVNLSLQHSTEVTLTPTQSRWPDARILSPTDGALSPPEGDTLRLPAGTGALIKLK